MRVGGKDVVVVLLCGALSEDCGVCGFVSFVLGVGFGGVRFSGGRIRVGFFVSLGLGLLVGTEEWEVE